MKKLLFASAFLLIACGESDDSPSTPLSLQPNEAPTSPEIHFLPYGVKAPDMLPANTMPEPYDPTKHGPPIQNQTPHLNLPEEHRTFLVRDQPEGLGLSAIPQGGVSKGLRWNSTMYPGIYGAHEVETGITLSPSSSNQVVFAPTALPSGSACIEMATTHRRYPATDTTTKHLAGWWNWCLSSGKPNSPSVEENMQNTLWKSWYVRSLTGVGDVFHIQIIKDTQQGYPCWNGLIYNYNFGYWESKIYSCYPVGRNSNWTGNGNEGWSLWEMSGVNEKPCPSFVGTGSYFLRAIGPNGSPLVNISQVAPNLSGFSGICWGSNSTWSMIYTKRTVDSDWRAKTPNL